MMHYFGITRVGGSKTTLQHSSPLEGREKPGHKWVSRKKGRNGKWQYTYETPKGGAGVRKLKGPTKDEKVYQDTMKTLLQYGNRLLAAQHLDTSNGVDMTGNSRIAKEEQAGYLKAYKDAMNGDLDAAKKLLNGFKERGFNVDPEDPQSVAKFASEVAHQSDEMSTSEVERRANQYYGKGHKH